MVDYLQYHPIINRAYSLLLNDDFRVLYEYTKASNDVFPDSIEIENIKFGTKFQKVDFNGRNKSEYESIYKKSFKSSTLKIGRKAVIRARRSCAQV